MQENEIAKKALLVDLSITGWSPRKLDKQETQDLCARKGADSSAAKVTKELLPPGTMDAIAHAVTAGREYYRSVTLPWLETGGRMLKAGIYLEFFETNEKLKADWQKEVAAFGAAYPGLVASAPARLNGLFKPEDFPAWERLARKFTWDARPLPLPTAEDYRLTLLDRELEELRESTARTVSAAVQAAQRDTWQRLAKPLAAMVERLTQPDAVFRDTLVSNLGDIVRCVPALNLLDDPTLAELARELEPLTSLDPQTLRDDKGERSKAAARAAELLARMQPFTGGGE